MLMSCYEGVLWSPPSTVPIGLFVVYMLNEGQLQSHLLLLANCVFVSSCLLRPPHKTIECSQVTSFSVTRMNFILIFSSRAVCSNGDDG